MIKRKRSEIIFQFFNTAFFILLSISIIFPFIRQLSISFSTPAEAIKYGLHIFPKEISLLTYERLIGTGYLNAAYFNTLFRIVIGTPLALIVTCLFAYALSKKHFPHRQLWTTAVILTMFFSGGLIPTYMLIKSLNLIDNLWVYILPNLLDPFIFIIARNFFLTIPDSLEESARLDGASDIRILISIFIPLSKPMLATIALWIIVGHWNSWFDGIIYINSFDRQVVQVILRRVMMEGQDMFKGMNPQREMELTPETVKAAIVVLTTFPILVIYPFLQKYFIKGIMLGAIKG